MINRINIENNYVSNLSNNKIIIKDKIEKNDEVLSKVDKIKEEIKNGTYKLDLEATSKKIAESLIQ
jgi:anti-sigma28 factor (negative regulator of flagellin synthesis)